MAEPMTLQDLERAVSGRAAAIRCRRRLEPAGGPGDKVFPPTYAGATYAVEKRRIRRNGTEEVVECVLLDSVQSQANRIEEALQDAVDAGRIRIPVIEVDFSSVDPTGDPDDDERQGRLLDPIGKVTSLQVPHRLADAILRDSLYDGKPFRESEVGREVDMASPRNATPLYRLCPTALVLGMWDSTGPKGGLGAKFARALVSEIVGIDATIIDHNRGIRRDPLGIRAAARVVKTSLRSWEVAEDPKTKNTVSPAEINHSNVPFGGKSDDNGGVTISYAEQTTTLSLVGLRRLRFPIDGRTDARVDDAARTVLAAMALCGATLAAENGYDLRSRCLLWPTGPVVWEILDRPGEPPRTFTLDADGAIALFEGAVERAKSLGLEWREEPLRLVPSPQLIDLVRTSQEIAATQGAEDE